MRVFRPSFVIHLLCTFVLTTCSVEVSYTQINTHKLHPMLHVMLEQQKRININLRKSGSEKELYPVIITTNYPHAVRVEGIHLNSVVGCYATARLSLDDIMRISNLEAVQYIQLPSINELQTDVSIPEIGAYHVQGGLLNNTPYTGKNVIVFIYDTGIDWKHLDFRKDDTTQSRILFIWDQTLTPINGERSPSGFDYGVEYTQADINDELDGSPTGYVRTRDYHGHGTHLASIAAGNGKTYNGKYRGVAPEADLIIVKGGDGSFSEAGMIDGLTYAKYKSEQLGKPIVVNWSIGSQYGQHDGTRPYEVAIDSFVAPGRIICVAAGNDGKYSLHAEGVLSKTTQATFRIIQPQYFPYSDSMKQVFDFMVWFQGDVSVSGPSALVASVRSPGGVIYSRSKDQHGTAPDTSDGVIYLANYKSTENNHRCIELYVRASSATPPRAGEWVLTVSTSQTSPIEYDAWIAIRAGARGIPGIELENSDNRKTVTSPGNSKRAITVGSYITKWSWPSDDGNVYSYSDYPSDQTGNISIFSGIGPTRDKRMKPEITAPGQGIAAALSSSVNSASVGNQLYPGGRYKIDLGTSQATPHVVGCIAVLLEINPTLQESEIKSLLEQSARKDEYSNTAPNSTWGYGKLDLINAVAQLVHGAQAKVLRSVLAYDNVSSYGPSIPITVHRKIALRFTPIVNGRVSGLNLVLPNPNERPLVGTGVLQCEIFTGINSLPGEKLGTTVSYPLSMLNPSTVNFIPLWDNTVSVESGQEYYVVLTVATEGDTVRVSTDGSSSVGRSLTWNGTEWTTLSNGNFKIRIELTAFDGTNTNHMKPFLPKTYELYCNYPNPFNASTRIQYQLPVYSFVTLKVYDLHGRELVTLENGYKEPGIHGVTFNGTEFSSGVYFVTLRSAVSGTIFRKSIKMLLVK